MGNYGELHRQTVPTYLDLNTVLDLVHSLKFDRMVQSRDGRCITACPPRLPALSSAPLPILPVIPVIIVVSSMTRIRYQTLQQVQPREARHSVALVLVDDPRQVAARRHTASR